MQPARAVCRIALNSPPRKALFPLLLPTRPPTLMDFASAQRTARHLFRQASIKASPFYQPALDALEELSPAVRAAVALAAVAVSVVVMVAASKALSKPKGRGRARRATTR